MGQRHSPVGIRAPQPFHDEGSQADIHAAGVVLDWRIDELLDLGEGYDLIELALDLRFLHREDGAVQAHITIVGGKPTGMLPTGTKPSVS